MICPQKSRREKLLGGFADLTIHVLSPFAALAGVAGLGQLIQPGQPGLLLAVGLWLGGGAIYAWIVRPLWRKRVDRQRPGRQRQYFWRDVKFMLGWPVFAACNLLGVDRPDY